MCAGVSRREKAKRIAEESASADSEENKRVGECRATAATVGIPSSTFLLVFSVARSFWLSFPDRTTREIPPGESRKKVERRA